MAFKDVFKNLFVVEDEEETVVTEEKKVRERPALKEVRPKAEPKKVQEKKIMKTNVVNMKPEMQSSSKVCLFEPRVFSDTQDIADELKNRRATLVNLQRIDKVSAKRIIDFLSGTVYAIGGDIQRIGQDIFLCTPDNVEVAGSISEVLEAPDMGESATDA